MLIGSQHAQGTNSPNQANGKKKVNKKKVDKKKKVSKGNAAQKKKEAAAEKPKANPIKDKVSLSGQGQEAGSQASSLVQGLQSSFAA